MLHPTRWAASAHDRDDPAKRSAERGRCPSDRRMGFRTHRFWGDTIPHPTSDTA